MDFKQQQLWQPKGDFHVKIVCFVCIHGISIFMWKLVVLKWYSRYIRYGGHYTASCENTHEHVRFEYFQYGCIYGGSPWSAVSVDFILLCRTSCTGSVGSRVSPQIKRSCNLLDFGLKEFTCICCINLVFVW